MPEFRNTRRERFAAMLAAGKAVKEAYEDAGFKYNRGNASRMAREPEVVARVSELMGVVTTEIITDAAVTRETIGRQLDEDRALATKNAQAGAAVRASLGKAQLYGLLKETGDGGITVNGNVNLTRIERIVVRPNGGTTHD